jgi:hypothetical protein
MKRLIHLIPDVRIPKRQCLQMFAIAVLQKSKEYREQGEIIRIALTRIMFDNSSEIDIIPSKSNELSA